MIFRAEYGYLIKLDWLHRISPCPRPVLAGMSEDCSYTGRGIHRPGWLEPLRVIYDHQLVLVSEGTFRTEIEGQAYICPPESFIIVPPGRWETTWNIGSKNGRRLWCHFDWVYQGPWDKIPLLTYHPARPRECFFRTAPGFVPDQVFHGAIPFPQLAFDIFERFFQMQQLGDAHDQLASRSVLLDLLIHLLDSRAEKAPAAREPVHLPSQIRKQLKNAVESGIPIRSIRSMLEKLHYSYAHLCRLFRAEYGVTPLKYVHTLRIDRAKLLLRDTRLGISEIAYRVGIND